MQKEEIRAIFDRQADSYDQQWSRMAPINGALHFLTDSVLSNLPATAHLLCVGSGTGAEILHLARQHPGWRFTAVEPSAAMLGVFQRKAEAAGIFPRCSLHAGYLESLPEGAAFDASTAFLVSQFILDQDSRSEFFGNIARRLCQGGTLVCSDLAGDLAGVEGGDLLEVWFRLMSGNGISAEGAGKMREAYARDVAVLPPDDVRNIIKRGGFASPVRFFQAGMIHAWYAARS